MTQISDIFVDPDNVGEAEYRAIYDLLEGVWKDMDDEDESYSDSQKLDHMLAMLNEFIVSAESMKRRLKVIRQQRNL